MILNFNGQPAVSEKIFNAFNITTTKSCGDMKNAEERNLFCRANSIDFKKIVFAQQVHGTVVSKVSSADCGRFVESCDGLITNDKNVYLCIFTADCMPVFMASRDYSVVALVHAGWRGLACGIIESALIKFRDEFGIMERDIFVYIGPHINRCCYEVGADVKKAFGIPQNGGKNLSLSDQAVKQLKNFGIKRIYTDSHCTCHETEMFFSYRRRPTEQRMMSLVCPKVLGF